MPGREPLFPDGDIARRIFSLAKRFELFFGQAGLPEFGVRLWGRSAINVFPLMNQKWMMIPAKALKPLKSILASLTLLREEPDGSVPWTKMAEKVPKIPE